MSVALVVIRFELVDWSNNPNLHYNATNFVMTSETPTDRDFQQYNDIDEIRGCREVRELSIETLTFKDEPVDGASATSCTPRSPIDGDLGEGCSYASVVQGRDRKSTRPLHSPPVEELDSPRLEADGTLAKRPGRNTPKLPASLELSFICGNPTVERVQGIIHLFKDIKKTSLEDGASRSEMICMLAVPASFTIHDLLTFTDHVYHNIEYMKIIKDHSPNNYMVIVKFRSQKGADEFYTNYNNTQFNTIEPDVCHLVYVARVDFLKASEGGAVPIPGLIELPNCPVCLERMDESVDGVLTILCNHSFHGHCLAKWGDTSCPVCRYSQTPEASGENYCFECKSTDSLWICLICGQVGCGRYVGGHAYEHFVRTNHTYAMQLSNSRVWDYVGDNYVHRLVQNKEDGKLVEMDEHGQRVTDEKIDSLTLEYTYLLTNQLESQRRYFEERIADLEKEAAERLAKVESRAESSWQQHEMSLAEVAVLRKEKAAADRKCTQLSTKLQTVLRQLQDEQALNKSLRNNQTEWQSKVIQLQNDKKQLEMELADTREQLTDILFHLEAHNKLSNSSEVNKNELEGSTVTVASAPNTPSKKGKKKQ